MIMIAELWLKITININTYYKKTWLWLGNYDLKLLVIYSAERHDMNYELWPWIKINAFYI